MASEDEIGRIGWVDMTTPDAPGLRDFYRGVVGWDSENVDMNDYSDFLMKTPGGEAVAGICHARGTNADLPPGWLIYIVVADLDASARACTELGGRLVVEPRGLAGGRFCVIADPAGAKAALFQPANA